jgi:hypothetical protein
MLFAGPNDLFFDPFFDLFFDLGINLTDIFTDILSSEESSESSSSDSGSSSLNVSIKGKPDPVMGKPSSVEFTFDADGTVSEYQYRLYRDSDVDGEWDTVSDWKPADGDSTSYSSPGEGKWKIEVKAKDSAGNWSDIKSYDWFIGDELYTAGRADGASYSIQGDIKGSLKSSTVGLRKLSGGSKGGWRLDFDGSYSSMPSTLSLTSGGKIFDSNNTRIGYWISIISDAEASGGTISGGSTTFTHLSYTKYGTGTGKPNGSYSDGTFNITDVGVGSYSETSLKFFSNIDSNDLFGMLGGTDEIWSSTQGDPAGIKMMGQTVSRKGFLDIHAADNGSTSGGGGTWDRLLPGGVTHTSLFADQNYIVDSDHAVVGNRSDNDYSGWNYVSHGYFTNLYSNTDRIFKDANNNPTTIEYVYDNEANNTRVHVLATTQTLEWTYKQNIANGKPLKDTIAYTLFRSGVNPNQRKVLLLQDVDPWDSSSTSSSATEDILKSWIGTSRYDVKSSSEFASLDLSSYSAIIIASDQSDTFYANIKDNISKLEGFSPSDSIKNWVDEIVSYNYSDSTYTTYDGGAYDGLFSIRKKDDNTGHANLFAIYVDPTGKAGILKGSVDGDYYSDINMWKADGSMYPVQFESSAGISASNLNSNINEDFFYSYDTIGSGTFSSGGSLSFNFLTGREKDIDGKKWGVWAMISGGTYSGTTSDSWNANLRHINSYKDFIMGIRVDGSTWSGNILEGNLRGYYADVPDDSSTSPETGIIVGEVIGTFDASTFTTTQAGVWIENSKFLDMACPGGTCNTSGTDFTDDQNRLRQLDIPVVQVGTTTLTGSGNNFSSITMSNVKFFAPSNGSRPTIWATDSVTGNYTQTPAVDTSVTLRNSSETLSADFTLRRWDTTHNKWIADIENGSGTLSGGSYEGSVSFKGAAGGTINTQEASISGTASGSSY